MGLGLRVHPKTPGPPVAPKSHGEVWLGLVEKRMFESLKAHLVKCHNMRLGKVECPGQSLGYLWFECFCAPSTL